MKRQLLRTLLCTALAVGGATVAYAGDLTGVRVSNYDGYSRVVMDLTSIPSNITANYDKSNHTIVFKFKDTKNQMASAVNQNTTKTGVLKGVQLQGNATDLTVTLSSSQDINYNTLVLKNPNRFVVDLFSNYTQKTSKSIAPNIESIKWSTTVKEGMIKVAAIEADDNVPMAIGNVPAGKTLKDVNQTYAVAIGLKGKNISDGTEKTIAFGAVIDDPTTLKSVGAIKYMPNKGYAIMEKSIQIQGTSNRNSFLVTTVDSVRKTESLVLYTPNYGASTGTNTYGYEVIVDKNKVAAIGTGNSKIPKNGYVLSGHGNGKASISALKVGDSITLKRAPELVQVKAVGGAIYSGGTIVLKDNRYVGPASSPLLGRTFIGTTTDNDLIVLTVDKKVPESVGVTTKEGVQLLTNLGAKDGLELTNQGEVDIRTPDTIVHQAGTNPTIYETIMVLK